VLFLDRIWQLRTHVTAYDAVYIALSEALDAPLVTTDVRLARTRGHCARIVAPA
jgi:predicted nucleic acid-binding protein